MEKIADNRREKGKRKENLQLLKDNFQRKMAEK